MNAFWRSAVVGAVTQAVVAGIGAFLLASTAGAQTDWPSKPTRVIVPFPAGGSSDVVARLLAEGLSARLKQPFLVENRAGAGGNIGTDAVAKAPPDGYTLGLSTSGPLANNRFLYKSIPYDAQKDLTPILLVGEIPLIVVAHPGLPASNLAELVTLARAGAGKLNAGSPGNGTIGHLALERFKSVHKIDLVHVPFKGDAPAMTELLAGNIQVVFSPATSYVKNIQAGKLRGLAVTAPARFEALKDVATAKEQGTDLEASVWFALVGPAGLPRPIVATLNAEANAILADAAVQAKLAGFGATVAGGNADRLGALMAAEAAKWKSVIEQTGVKLD